MVTKEREKLGAHSENLITIFFNVNEQPTKGVHHDGAYSIKFRLPRLEIAGAYQAQRYSSNHVTIITNDARVEEKTEFAYHCQGQEY